MNIHEALLKYWGYKTFRPLQEDIINCVLEGKDTLALLPTGGGKSICFQVPAMVQEGICVVISPLIALMKDQVENLKKRGIPALSVYSGMSKREIEITLDNAVFGNYKFLYVSPERLQTPIFIERFKKMPVSFVAIDEAHCISQWGYDFRPPYLKIAELRTIKPKLNFIALTATATPEVVEDIQNKLQFKAKNVLQKSFERKNLAYVVLHEENKLERLIKILDKIPGTAVVYVRNRKRTKEVAHYLQKLNISADYYHAGLDGDTRDYKQQQWIDNKTRVIVATNAFGMGIDKPNVRLVVHLDLPDSLEAYFQEAGRAGRDEKKAYAVLLFEEADKVQLEKSVEAAFPPLATIKNVYQALANYFQIPEGSGLNESFDFNITDFANKYEFKLIEVYNAIKFLEKEGYLLITDKEHLHSRVKIIVPKDQLYDFQVRNPSFDQLIKLLLRSYTGLFDQYTKIDEALLAKRLNTTSDKLKLALSKLNELKYIEYLPQTNQPKIVFLTPRLPVKNLLISKENYSLRKKIITEKAQKVIYYATSHHKCRSLILLEYFGEKEAARCGVCDVCLERNKLNLSDLEFSTISDQIKEQLKKEPQTLSELVKKIKYSREDKIIEVIQWSVDNHKIVYNDKVELEWKK
ncbi:MAG: ATP-dependent DNA helicase RecQ [Vicingaceae bacterium]